MKNSWSCLAGLSLLVGTCFLHAAPKEYPEAKPEVRTKAATAILQKEKEIALLYVKGLCCPSCAIGVRSKLSRLKYVDKKRFKRGVDMNAETQLVTLALKTGQVIDPLRVEKEVDDAGYIAIEWYTFEDANLKAHPFPGQKP
ncbi:MAG: heavy-metal-associated domain-containing protein [Opitutae bacterium]|nr:heavy-metal-associated domain-containing protein [Opitutae bacterium]MBT5690688.1 heavy-metal-associated domain-containing protein [Opitutae bacterium]MBT7853558.1 heavy-metal-associated domain-containing protein [Opitutae bacterium]